jgi:hypothetical protein
MMFQTSDNSQLCIDSQHFSQQLILIFSRVKVLHLDRLDYIALVSPEINRKCAIPKMFGGHACQVGGLGLNLHDFHSSLLLLFNRFGANN